jgi:hypothetical protein
LQCVLLSHLIHVRKTPIFHIQTNSAPFDPPVASTGDILLVGEEPDTPEPTLLMPKHSDALSHPAFPRNTHASLICHSAASVAQPYGLTRRGRTYSLNQRETLKSPQSHDIPHGPTPLCVISPRPRKVHLLCKISTRIAHFAYRRLPLPIQTLQD